MLRDSKVPSTAAPKPLLVAVGQCAGKGSPWKGSCSFTQHQPRACVATSSSPPSLAALIPPCARPLFRGLTQNPLPFSLCSLENLRLSDRNTLLSAPSYRKAEVHVWRTAAVTQNTWAYSYFIRELFPSVLLDLIPSNWFLCFLLFLT